MPIPKSNRAHIRQFVIQFFNDQELSSLCFEYFPFVYEQFTDSMTKGRKVLLLIEGCENRGKVSGLLAALKRERPQLYAEYFTQEPTASLPESKPVTRNLRQIFISHAHQDAEFAQRLANDLRAHGWDIWIAPDSIQPGEKWVEAINRGLTESGVFVLVLSPAAVDSNWVQKETNAAIGMENAGNITLIPLAWQPADEPPLWGTYQRIAFQDNYEIGLVKLLERLQPDVMAQLRRRYHHLQTAIARKEWQTAEELGRHIQERYPGYQETTLLLDQVRQEKEQSKTREGKAQQLYTQLESTLTAEEWDEASHSSKNQSKKLLSNSSNRILIVATILIVLSCFFFLAFMWFRGGDLLMEALGLI